MKVYKFSNVLIGFLLLVLLTANFRASNSHTFHTSLTRIDYNEKEKLAEISIQLFTHDLTQILEKQTKKRIDLEKTIDADKLIFDYLKENFVLTDKNGAIKKLVWVGKELDVDTAYIYLEIPLKESLEDFSLQNTIFFESFPEQTNLVTARFNKKKADLLFKVGDKVKEIRNEK